MKRLLFLLLPLLAASFAYAKVADRLVRQSIAGVDVLLLPTEIEDVIFFRGSLPAGKVFNPPDNPVLADLVAAMLDKGTTAHDKFALAKLLEDTGATLSFSGGSHCVTFSGRCLKEDLPQVVGLIAEQLRTPAFNAEELAKLKKQLVAGWKRDEEDPGRRAAGEFSRAIYPSGHPNRTPTLAERTAALEATTVDDLRKFHSAHYGADHLVIVVAGDLDQSAVTGAIGKEFAHWPGGTALPAPTAADQVTDGPAERIAAIPGKTSANIFWGGTTGLRYTDPDTIPLRIGTAILGSGFTGRLMHGVRDRDGLTYGIGARVANDDFAPGDWGISATFAPALLDKGIASTKRELTAWLDQGVTAQELADRKSGMIGSYQVGLARTNDLAGAILTAIQRGQSPAAVDEYPNKIAQATLGEVNAAIHAHVHPDRLVLIKAGTVTPAN